MSYSIPDPDPAAGIVSALTGGTGVPSSAAGEYLVGDEEDEDYQESVFHYIFLLHL